MWPARAFRAVVCFLLVLPLAACATPRPLDPAMLTGQRWQAVREAYEGAVHAALQSPARTWHHGWLGNLTVLNQGPPHMGLCWQWRDELDSALGPVITRQGLAVLGIHARRGTRMEHNALLVYDPALVPPARVLRAAEPLSGFEPAALVLDPWFTGAPAMYSIPEWSRLGSDAHPVGIDLRPFPVGEMSGAVRRAGNPE